MESNTRTKTIERETNLNAFANNDTDSRRTKERLDLILAANAEYARKNDLFKDEKEQLEAEMMSNPMSAEKAYSYFGALLGAIAPATIFGRILFESGNLREEEMGFLLLFVIANLVSTVVGYYTGKAVGKIALELEKVSWNWMILAMPFIGILWGLISGGVGGIFIFVIGAIFGGIIGGMVGGVALPAFTLLHRLFKKGDKIDSKHFYPIAFGITLTISAVILSIGN